MSDETQLPYFPVGYTFTVVQQEQLPIEGFTFTVNWPPGPHLVIAQVPVYNFTDEAWPISAVLETASQDPEYGHMVAAPGQPWDDGYQGGAVLVLTSVMTIMPVPKAPSVGLPLTLKCQGGGPAPVPPAVTTTLARLTGVRLAGINADVQP